MFPPRVVLAAVDFSESSRTALTFAARLARHADARLHVVHAQDPLLAQAARAAGVDIDAETRAELTRFMATAAPAGDWSPFQEVADGPAAEVEASSLSYTVEDQTEELDPSNFAAAARASDRATLLEQVLAQQTLLERQVLDEVLVTLSEQHRARPRLGRAAAGRIDAALQAELDKVTLEVPSGGVTLSSDSGPLGVTLVNGLDQPVSVRVQVATDGDTGCVVIRGEVWCWGENTAGQLGQGDAAPRTGPVRVRW